MDALHKSNILEMGDELTSNKVYSLYKVSTQVIKMSSESGLVGADMHQWLKQMASNPDDEALTELNEIELMLNELYWQLKNACRACDESLSKSEASKQTQFAIREAYTTVGLTLGDLEDRK